MLVLVTGSRTWWDYITIRQALADLAETFHGDVQVLHGGARGADMLAHRAALDLRLAVDVYQAVLVQHYRPIRNTPPVWWRAWVERPTYVDARGWTHVRAPYSRASW